MAKQKVFRVLYESDPINESKRSLQEFPADIVFAKTAEYLSPMDQSALRATCKAAAETIPSPVVDPAINNAESAGSFFTTVMGRVIACANRNAFLPRDVATVQLLCHLLTVAYPGFVFIPKGQQESMDIRDVMFLRTWRRPSAAVTDLWHMMRYHLPFIIFFLIDEISRRLLSSMQDMYPAGHPLIHDHTTIRNIHSFDPANREAILRAEFRARRSFEQILRHVNGLRVSRTQALTFLMPKMLDVPIRSPCPNSLFDLLEGIRQPVFSSPWPTPCPQKPLTLTNVHTMLRFRPSRPAHKLVCRYMFSEQRFIRVEGVEIVTIKNCVPAPTAEKTITVHGKQFVVFEDENPWKVFYKTHMNAEFADANRHTYFHACMFLFEVPDLPTL
jgi:hypothetical protein